MSILFEHGYKTEIFQLPFQNTELKKKVLIKNNSRLQKKHLIVDDITYSSLKKELETIQDSTLTIVSSQEIQTQSAFVFLTNKAALVPLSYHVHQLWCSILGLKTPEYSTLLNNCTESTWHAFLGHCVHLAEIDFESE